MKAAVKDVMTTHVVAVRQDATYKIMVASLRGRHISALPVLDDQDKVVGVVSEADLLAKEALEVGPHGYTGGILPHEQLAKATGVTAADLMTRPAITIAAGDTAAQAARLMYGKRVKRLPVVTADGHLVGIVPAPTSSACTAGRTGTSGTKSPRRCSLKPSAPTPPGSRSLSRTES